MLKKVLLIASFMLSSVVSVVIAQELTAEQKKKMERAMLVPTCIITMNGDTVYGFSKRIYSSSRVDATNKSHDYTPNYYHQLDVDFISNDDFDANLKIKNSMLKKYKPSELKGYVYDYYDYYGERRVLESAHFKTIANSDMSIMNGQYFLTYKATCKNGDKLYVVFLVYDRGFSVDGGRWEEIKDFTVPHTAIRFNGSKEVKCAEDLNPETDYPCSVIAERAKNNIYTDVSSKEGSKLNKLSKFGAKMNSDNKNEMRKRAFKDYLESCADK